MGRCAVSQHYEFMSSFAEYQQHRQNECDEHEPRRYVRADRSATCKRSEHESCRYGNDLERDMLPGP